jgi:hypothetical protein
MSSWVEKGTWTVREPSFAIETTEGTGVPRPALPDIGAGGTIEPVLGCAGSLLSTEGAKPAAVVDPP